VCIFTVWSHHFHCFGRSQHAAFIDLVGRSACIPLFDRSGCFRWVRDIHCSGRWGLSRSLLKHPDRWNSGFPPRHVWWSWSGGRVLHGRVSWLSAWVNRPRLWPRSAGVKAGAEAGSWSCRLVGAATGWFAAAWARAFYGLKHVRPRGEPARSCTNQSAVSRPGLHPCRPRHEEEGDWVFSRSNKRTRRQKLSLIPQSWSFVQFEQCFVINNIREV